MKKALLIIALAISLNSLIGQDNGNIALINGIEMYYEIHGSGDPLILLHGFLGSGDFWDPFIESFSKYFKVIVPDLRGHGKSTNPLDHWTMSQSARDIYALMDHLKIERCNCVGFSTGAKTLLHMATQNSQRIEAMILIGGAMYYPDDLRKILAEFQLTEDQWDEYRKIHEHGDDQIKKLVRQFNECADDYDDMTFVPPDLARIKAKTLIVHGDRDWGYPVSMASQMYESIPNSYLWVVPNGSHWPITQSNSEAFIKTSTEFLIKWN
jgi:pimeloyl-ACP methyl ester carboxylesterase